MSDSGDAISTGHTVPRERRAFACKETQRNIKKKASVFETLAFSMTL